MPDENADQGGSAPERWEGAPAPQVYSNIVMTAAGPFDVTLVFGHQDNAYQTETSSPTTTEVARVAMSWGHLKSMIPLMARLVAQYETQIGEIPAPGFEQNWKE